MDHRQVRTLAESFPPRLMNLHLALRPRHARTSLLCYALHCFASPGAAHTSLALAFNHSRLARLAPCQMHGCSKVLSLPPDMSMLSLNFSVCPPAAHLSCLEFSFNIVNIVYSMEELMSVR